MGRDEHIGFHLRTADVLAKRFRESLGELNPVERLTGLQGWVVGYLYEHRDADVFQRDLESVFSVRRSTMTNILQLMEKNGYIKRESVYHDARLKKIILLPKAISSHEYVMQTIRETERKIAEGLTQEEIDTFLHIIKKIEKNLDTKHYQDGGTL